MRIKLAKHGGWTAGLPMPPRAVESNTLNEHAAAELHGLVAAAKADSPAKTAEPTGGADLMSYTITIDDAGQPVVLHQSDSGMTPAFSALLNWLERHLPAK
jgi:hypothetical protein